MYRRNFHQQSNAWVVVLDDVSKMIKIESAQGSEREFTLEPVDSFEIEQDTYCTQVNDFNAIRLTKMKTPEKKEEEEEEQKTTSNSVVMEWSHTKLNG